MGKRAVEEDHEEMVFQKLREDFQEKVKQLIKSNPKVRSR